MQALLTNILQRHWERQEDRRTDLEPKFYRNNTAFLSSLDARTAFDGTKPSVVSRILSLTGVHGQWRLCWVRFRTFKGRPASKIVRRSSGTRGASRQGGVEAPSVVGARGQITCCGRPRKSVKPRGWGPAFGEESDNEYVLRGGLTIIGCSVTTRKDWWAW